MSERKKQAHWVQNLIHNPSVSFSVSGKTFDGRAGIVSSDSDVTVAAKVSELMDKKYGWSDGLIVELTPEVTAES